MKHWYERGEPIGSLSVEEGRMRSRRSQVSKSLICEQGFPLRLKTNAEMEVHLL